MSTLVSVNEAARELQISRSTVYELIGQGRIEVVRIGRSVRIPSAALAAFVEGLRSTTVNGEVMEDDLDAAS